MSNSFLASSAEYDANDLSSVVQEGGHWCICAWAWASAVSRDPVNYEGIVLDCDRTNARLRNVYELFIEQNQKMTSPSGAQYAVEQALEQVNKVCDPSKTTDAPATSAPATSAPTTVVTTSTTSSENESTTGSGTADAATEVQATEKPATASSGTEVVTLSMTMRNVEFTKLDAPAKEALATKCEEVIAEQAGVSKSAVRVTLSSGSVIITAEIQLPEGQPASSIQAAVQEGDMSSQVVAAAKTIPSVKDAATGEIEVTPVEIVTSGGDFTANAQPEDSSKAPAPPAEAITTTKANADPLAQKQSSPASGTGYPSMILACVLPLLAVSMICSHKPTTSTAPQIRDPLVDGTEMAQVG
jgi:hypothetical protein